MKEPQKYREADLLEFLELDYYALREQLLTFLAECDHG